MNTKAWTEPQAIAVLFGVTRGLLDSATWRRAFAKRSNTNWSGCTCRVEKGGCKWDRLTQMLCKDSCNRCGDNFNKQPSDVGVPMGLASLPGFANLSQTSQQKRHQALVAPHMLEVGQKVLVPLSLCR
jgi:hypothetical protein